MQINLEYLAKLCSVFLDSDTAMVGLKNLEIGGVEVGSPFLNESFLFHIQLMLDSNLVSDPNGESFGLPTIGVLLNGDGSYRNQHKKFRLTQKGHDFAKSLNNKEILKKLTTQLKDAPFKSIFDGGQKLLEHYAKKKLDQLLTSE